MVTYVFLLRITISFSPISTSNSKLRSLPRTLLQPDFLPVSCITMSPQDTNKIRSLAPQDLVPTENVQLEAMQTDLAPSTDIRTLPPRDISTISKSQRHFDEYFQGWEDRPDVSLLDTHRRTSLNSSLPNTSVSAEDAIELSDFVGLSSLAPNCQNSSPPSESQASHGILLKGQLRSHWWWWEIAAVVFSMTCMMAAVVVLANINNTRLSDWSWYLQPNTIISILVTLAKSTMLFSVSTCLSQLKWRHFQDRSAGRPLTHLQDFDEASRGPLGALFLLGNRHLAAFAPFTLALITVASLAIDPMAQEVLKFPSQESLLQNVTTGIGQAYSFFLNPDDQDSISVRPYPCIQSI